eukprot:Opistho-2@75307
MSASPADALLRAPKADVSEAAERDWSANGRSKVWVWKNGAYAAASVVERGDDGNVKVQFETGDSATIGEEQAERMNHPRLCTVENLTDLDAVNVASSVHLLQQRYTAGLVHTFAGNGLIVVNPHKDLPIYGDSVMPLFRCPLDAMPPHIYAVAESAYRSAVTEASRRVVIFTGEVGSGKTHSFARAVHYIASVAVGSTRAKKGAKSDSASASSSSSSSPASSVRTLLSSAIEPIFAAFASARTPRSPNSSRAGRMFTLEFDGAGGLVGANVQCFAFERSRLTHSPEGERTFDALYQIVRASERELHGLPTDSGVEKAASSCRYLNGANADASDGARWKDTDTALASIGLGEEERKALWSILAAIVHLGCLVPKAGSAATSFESDAPLQAAARLLGVPAADLASAILTQVPRSPSKDALCAAVDTLSRGLYERVVLQLIAQMNSAVQSRVEQRSSVSLIDYGGFDGRCDASSSPDAHARMCANALAEKLRAIHHSKSLVEPQAEYGTAGISWAEIDFGVSPSAAASDAIFASVFPALEEESQSVGDSSNTDGLLLRVAKTLPATSSASIGASGVALAVAHAGGCTVEYGVDVSFLDCDRGALSPQVLQALSLSSKHALAELFQTVPQASLAFRRIGGAGASSASALPSVRSGGARNRSLAMQQ